MIARFKLKDIGTIITGNTPKTSDNRNYDSNDICFVKPSDIDDNELSDLCSSECYISEYARGKARIVPAQSVLVTCIGIIGKVGVNSVDCAFNQQINAIIPNIEKCDCRYLAYAIQRERPKLQSIANAPVVPILNKSQFSDIEIPLPSLAEQRKIAAVLDKVSNLIAKRHQQLDKLDELVKSRFVEMFGDPTYNPKGYKIKKLSQLGELNRGVSKARPRNSPELLGGPYPLVQTGEVTASELYINTYENTYSEKGLAQSRMWPKGTLCITIAANIAQTAILNIDACFPDSVVGFIPGKEVTQIYMHYWFTFFQKILEEQAPQVAQKNINLKILNDLDVMVPERTLQEQFEKLVNQTDKSKLTIQKTLDKLEILKKALMQEYFG